MKTKIGLNDLKLLVDVSNAHEIGQSDFLVGAGFGEARKRLKRAGLIDENPTSILPIVRITVEGQNAVDRMLNLLEGVFFHS